MLFATPEVSRNDTQITRDCEYYFGYRPGTRAGRKDPAMKASVHLFVSSILLLLCAAASTPAAHAGDKKPKSDWDAYFGAGIAPPYPFSGVLQVTVSSDYEFSNTDANGDTTSFHCSSDEYRTDCYDGPGVSFELVQPDGNYISVSRTPWIEQDTLKWMLSAGDALFENPIEDAKAGRIFHFRWKEDPYGLSGRLLCVPIAGTESIPDGKARKEYAKNHRMESCYFAEPWPAHPNPTPEVQAITKNSEAGKASPAAAAALADEGRVLSPQEMAERIQKGEASKCAVVTVPAGAKIWIDGNEAGVSPMVFVLTRHGDTPRSIKVTLDGYKTVEKQVVPDGKTIPIGLTLEPK
jgi:hypothetical protein